MMFAAELSRLTGSLSDAVVDRQRRVLESLTLPTSYPLGRWETLLAAMQRDKKTRGNLLRFVVLDRAGSARIMEVPDPSILFACYQEIAE